MLFFNKLLKNHLTNHQSSENNRISAINKMPVLAITTMIRGCESKQAHIVIFKNNAVLKITIDSRMRVKTST
jgi:hypothetical protein